MFLLRIDCVVYQVPGAKAKKNTDGRMTGTMYAQEQEKAKANGSKQGRKTGKIRGFRGIQDQKNEKRETKTILMRAGFVGRSGKKNSVN